MTIRYLAAAALLLGLAGCDDILTTSPTTTVRSDEAIQDAGSARAARMGLYQALQSESYYGGEVLFHADLPTDDARHSGTFTSYADMNQTNFLSSSGTFNDMWVAIYRSAARATMLIEQLKSVADLDAGTKNQYLGEAHFLRALAFHNAVKMWGDVPVPTSTPATTREAAQVSRAPVAEVYSRIHAELDRAAELMTDAAQTRMASVAAVHALRGRVHLFRENWQGVVDAATAVEAYGFELAANYPDLFDANGANTPEDIFRVRFTPQEYNLVGYYYLSRSAGGRWEIAPTAALEAAFEPGDVRKDWTIAFDALGRHYSPKWPTAVGAEDIHVIRFGEVLLNMAEALARLDRLAEAVDAYSRIRERAGLAPHVLGTHVTTQQQVLEAIWQERRVELALEGFRWHDLVRTGRAVQVLGIAAHKTLFPVPQAQRDVAPNLTQNPGY